MKVEDILANLIRIDTVNPPGGELEVAKYLKNLFDQYEIPNEIIEPSPGRGNFIAQLGEGERSLLYLSHTDVVPISEGWSFEPFSGAIRDGFVYGRGALDCKGLVAAEACAIIKLATEAKLKGRLIFAATADEETGGKFGVQYLLQNYRDKIWADFAINEGAEPPAMIGEKICHFISTGEKGPLWITLKTRGTSSHGSLPMLGDNAVVKMADAIRSLTAFRSETVLIPEVAALIRAVAELQGLEGDITETNTDQVIKRLDDKVFAGYLKAITRMTVSPNYVHGGIKTNIVPDYCEAKVDIRVLPSQDKGSVAMELSQLIGDVEIIVDHYSAPTFSKSDSQTYHLISNTLIDFIGDAPILPSISSGTTDSRFLREAGIPSYGISMMTLNQDPKMRQAIHGKDEKIDVDSLRLKSAFLASLAKKYLGN